MTARIAGSSDGGTTFTAMARQLPRLAVAIGATRRLGRYNRLVQSTDTTVVVTETTDPVTGAKRTNRRLETTDTASIEEVDRNLDGDVAFGIDFPIRPTWHRMRTFVGVSARNPTDIYYVGFSPLQAAKYGVQMEAIGIDGFAGLRLTNRKVGTTRGCDGTLPCEKRDFRIDGWFISAVVDGSQLLSAVLKPFIP